MASWQEIEPHLLALLDLGDAQRQQRFAELALEQPDLAAELARLLDAAEQTRWDAQMSGAAAADVVQSLGEQLERDQDRTGERIGSYRLASLLGRGGMGAVYLAQRADGAYEQTAALKLLPGRSMDSAAGERFVLERQILARLEHPNIARLLDGGITPDGNPYFVMEYVDGANIADYCDTCSLNVDARLALFLKLLAAVTFAHANMVVHGDLKPDNVLVTAQGQPKLLDFGIATALDRSEEAAVVPVALTPNYASPEQLSGAPATALSDLYALGVLLYRLLIGQLPRKFSGQSIADIRESLVPAGHLQPVDPAAMSGVSRELQCIVLRALAQDPADRYASVADFQADLVRFRAQQPVLAHPPGRLYALRKFVSRHRTGAVLTVLAAVALVAGLAAVTLSAQRASEAAARAERVSGFLQSLFDAANPFGAWKEEKSVVDLLSYADQRYQQDLADDPQALAQMQDMLGVAYLGSGEYSRAVQLLQEALATVSQQHDERSPEVAQAHNHLAHALIENGSYADGKQHSEQALRSYTELGSEYALEQADAMTNLAVATSNLGDKDAAEQLHAEALAIRTERLPPNDTRIADSKMSLAAVQAAQRNYSKVLSLNQAAHAIYVEQFGADHPMAVRAMNGVASGAFLTREYDSAAAAFEQLVSLSESRLGEDHPELALPLNNLGRVLTETGNFAAAERALARAVQLTSTVEGSNMLAASALFNHATVLVEVGAFDLAQKRLDASEAAFTALVGAEHLLVRRTQTLRAASLGLQNRHQAAQRWLEQMIAAVDDSPGNAATRASLAFGLARISNRQGRYDNALTLLTPVYGLLSQSMPASSWRHTELELEQALAAQDPAAIRRLVQQLSERLPPQSVRRQQALALIRAEGFEDAVSKTASSDG